MYKISTDDKTTYTIQLDALDLNCLKRSFDHGSDKPMPLWSARKGEDYYEFKLNAWRILQNESEEEESEPLPTEFVICHICNTHVPSDYINAHNNSTRHTNMKKIHDLLTLRGRNINHVGPSEALKQSKINYYCEECSMVILKNNKESHEASYTHKKALRNTDLIEQFLEYYSEDVKAKRKNNMKTLPLRDYFNKYINRKNLSFQIIAINEDSLTIEIEENELKIHVNNFHGFIEANGGLICILCEAKVPNVEILIEQHIESKKHRKKIIRNIDDEHCLREISEDFAHCILCNELILTTRLAGHKSLTYHRVNFNRALGIIDSKHFNKNYLLAREAVGTKFANYLSDKLTDDEGSCEDQTEVCEDYYESCNSKIVSIENSENKRNLNQTYCNVCSVYIDTHNFKSHKLGNIHRQLESSKKIADENNLKKVRSFIYNDAGPELANTNEHPIVKEVVAVSDVEVINPVLVNVNAASELEQKSDKSETESIEKPLDFKENVDYLILETSIEKEIICKVCCVLMSNADTNIYNHFNSDDHTTKYNELLKANKITKAQNKFYCSSCKVSFTSKNELVHILGSKHRNKFPRSESCDRIFCQFCKIHISGSVTEHQKTKIHLQVCVSNKKIIEEVITEYIFLDNVKITYIKTSNNENVKAAVPINAPVAVSNHAENFYLTHNRLIAKTKNPSEVLCKICDLTLMSSMVNVFIHITGFDHKNKYNSLLASNRIEIKDRKSFYCKLCDAILSKKDEISHIYSAKHKRTMQKKTDIVQSSDDRLGHSDVRQVRSEDENTSPNHENTEISNEILQITDDKHVQTVGEINIQTDATNSMSVADREIVQVDFLKPHYHVTKTLKPSKMLCKICDVILKNSIPNINKHIKGLNHTNKYKAFLESNKVTKDNDKFYCDYCNAFIPHKCDIDHILGNRHKNSLARKMGSGEKDVRRLNNDNVQNFNSEHVESSYEDSVESEYDEDIDHEQSSYDEESEHGEHTYEEVNEHGEQAYDEESDHVQSAHDEEIAQALTTEPINTPSVDNDFVQPVFLKPHYHVTKIPDTSDVRCKICNIIMFNSTVNINMHINGKNHRNKYNTLLESNKVKKGDNRFDCEICKVVISNKNEIDHILGARHRNGLEQHNVQNMRNEDIQSLNDSDDSSDDDIIQEDLLNLHYHVAKTSDHSNVLCKICNVILSNSIANVNSHIKGFKHKNDYKELLKTNYVKKTDDKFYCEICGTFISNKNEIQHIMGLRHKSAFSLLNIAECDVCNIRVPSMEVHLRSQGHDTMLKLKGWCNPLYKILLQNRQRNTI